MSTPERDHSVSGDHATGLPRAFGDYLLLHQLGRGGMGEVYLAKTGGIAGIEKLCVVKTLRGDLTMDEEYKQRFIDEARVVVQLGHRNICHVFDVGRVGHNYYLAMEHVAGRDVRGILRKAWDESYKIPHDVMIYLISEVLEALDYAHRLKDPLTGDPLHVVHRDVSPQNIMVNFEGEVKLIDFGLAQSTMKIERTAPRIVMGKLAYMPPEQARGHDVDGRVDQFAIGVMCYEAVSGRSFYEGKTAEQVWMLSGRGGHRPEAFAELDPQLRDILDRALNVEPQQRYATCQDFRQDLMRYNLARGSLAGARELRELMDALFYDDVNTDRSMLQRFANVKPLDPRPRDKPKKTVRIATAVVRREDVGLGPAEGSQTGSVPSVPDAIVDPNAGDGATQPGVDAPVRTERGAVEPTQIVRSGPAPTEYDQEGASTQREMADEATVIKPQPSARTLAVEDDLDPTEQVAPDEQLDYAPTPHKPARRDEATQLVRGRSRPDVGVLRVPDEPRKKTRVPLLIAVGACLIVVTAGLGATLLSDFDSSESVSVAATPTPAPNGVRVEPAVAEPAVAEPAVVEPPGAAPAVADQNEEPTAEPGDNARKPGAAKRAPDESAQEAEKTAAKKKAERRRRGRRKPPPPAPAKPLITAGAKLTYLKANCFDRVGCAKKLVDGQQSAFADTDKLAKWKKQLDPCVRRCRQ